MIWICDASALSALAETGMVDLLPEVFGEVVICDAVVRECLHERAPALLRELLAAPPAWMEIRPDPDGLIPEVAQLGAGEANTLSLAVATPGPAAVIVDEQAARRIARGLGLHVVGVLGIFEEAAKRGLIELDPALEKLLATGFRLSPALVHQVRSGLGLE